MKRRCGAKGADVGDKTSFAPVSRPPARCRPWTPFQEAEAKALDEHVRMPVEVAVDALDLPEVKT
jgi:hypothetical protein